MEESEGSKKQKELQMQDSNQEEQVFLGDLQLNQSLQTNEESTQNVIDQDSLQTEESTQKVFDQNSLQTDEESRENIREKDSIKTDEESKQNFLEPDSVQTDEELRQNIPEQDSIQTDEEARQNVPERDSIQTNEEARHNLPEQDSIQTNEEARHNLPEQDSIQTNEEARHNLPEQYSIQTDDEARQNVPQQDSIKTDERSRQNVPQHGSIQTDEESRQNGREKDSIQTNEENGESCAEQEKETRQKNVTTGGVSKIPAELGTSRYDSQDQKMKQQKKELEKFFAEYEIPCNVSKRPLEVGITQFETQNEKMMQQKEELRKLLAEYFNKQKQATMQQRTENLNEILISQAQGLVPTAEHDSDAVPQEEWDRNAEKEQLEANAALQHRTDLQRKLSILSSEKDSVQQPCAVLEGNMKGREGQDITIQQENQKCVKPLKPLTETGTIQYNPQNQKLTQREQERKKMLADYFSKQTQINRQETMICHIKKATSFKNSEETELQKPNETGTYGEPEVNRNSHPRNPGRSVSVDGTLVDETMRQSEAKDDKKLGSDKPFPNRDYNVKPQCPPPFKNYVTLHRRESKDITVRPPKVKDYVTCHRREPVCSSKANYSMTLRPQRSDNETVCTKCFCASSSEKDHFADELKNSLPLPEPTFMFSQKSASSTKSENLPRISLKEKVPQETKNSLPEPTSGLSPALTSGLSPAPTRGLSPAPTRGLSPAPTSGLSHAPTKSLSPAPSPSPQQYPNFQEEGLGEITEEIPLVSSEDACSEVTSETGETGAERNGKMMILLSRGAQDISRRFREHLHLRECQACIKNFTAACTLIFFTLFSAGIIFGLVQLVICLVKFETSTSGSNGSTLNVSPLNLTFQVTDSKPYRQNESLDSKANDTLLTRLVDYEINFTTPLSDFDANISNSIPDLDSEIIHEVNDLNGDAYTHEINSEMNMATLATSSSLSDFDSEIIHEINYLNGNVYTHEINSEIKMATFATNLDVQSIPFYKGVTTLDTNFEVNVITPVTVIDFNGINPVIDLDCSFDFNDSISTCMTV